MSISQNFPNIDPTLRLNFQGARRLDPRITFTRSSTATYVDEDGLIKTAAADEARFDYDPETGESLGLLIEESRTNLITRSTATGATNGVIGSGGALPSGWNFDQMQPGITVEIIGSGTEKGLTYVDIRFSGTPTTTNRTLIRPGSFFTINGETYYLTAYSKLVSGTNNLSHTNFDYGALSLTSELKRNTGAIRSGLTGTFYPRFDIGMNAVGQPCDITIRFAAPQMELGAFPTSYIPTSGSQVTRQPDNASITGTNFTDFYSGISNSSIFVECVVPYTEVGLDPRLLSFRPLSGNASYDISLLSSQIPTLGLRTALNIIISSKSISPKTSTKISARLSPGDLALSCDGENAQTSTYTLTDNFNALDIGAFNSSPYRFINSTIKQLTYYPKRLKDTSLQYLTQ